MDLAKQFPRSPYAKVGGYTWLGRMIDKARAHAAGTAGEYHYSCPMDNAFLTFWGLRSEDFLAQAAAAKSDDELAAWVKAQARIRSAEEIRQFEIELLDTPPGNAESLGYLEVMRERIAQGRADLDTWAKVLVVEEGHPLPTKVG